MNTELSKINTSAALPDEDLLQLADKIVQIIEEGKHVLAISISETIKKTYWEIGHNIVEFEQGGNARAKYGTALLSNLSKILRARVGRGYSHPNLNNMRKFYLMFPKFQTPDKSAENFQTSEKLTWSHICELITIEDDLERELYAKECIAENWTVDYLHRQKESGLFMRLAASLDANNEYLLDMSGVEQISRSAADELYNLTHSGMHVDLINIEPFVEKMLSVVTKGRFLPRQHTAGDMPIIHCATIGSVQRRLMAR